MCRVQLCVMNSTITNMVNSGKSNMVKIDLSDYSIYD